MGSADRRWPGRRPPFGAPRRQWREGEDEESPDWWLDEWLDEPAQVKLVQEPPPDRRRTPDWRRWPDRAARRGWLDRAVRRAWPDRMALRGWLDAATRHPWYTAIGAGATFMVLASSVIVILPKHSPAAMAAVPVQAPSVPITVPVASPSATPSPSPSATPRVSPPPAASAPPATMPAVMATVAPRAPATITVTITYTPTEIWSGGLTGEFTITNDTSASIAGWQLSAEFPGDQIQVTWGPIEPGPLGGAIVMEPQPDWPSIAPGASQSGFFVALGGTIYPSSCTFDGTACFGSDDQAQASG